MAFASPSTDFSFNPRLRMVSIIPGMDLAEPDRTLTSSGSFASPSFFPVSFSRRAIFLATSARKFLGIFLAVLQVVVAGFRGDREARRNRQADPRHFGETRSLAAEQIFHVSVAVRFSAPKK